MLRPVRRKLRLIRYYSASRDGGIWGRASDWILMGSFALAVPAAMLSNVTIMRTEIAVTQTGVMSRDAGRVHAILETEVEPLPPWTGTMLGRFTLRIIEEHRGWPLVTSVRRRPAEVEYDIYREEQKRVDVGRAVDAPMRDAIEAALEDGGRTDLLASWRSASPASESASPLRWIFSSVMWWVLLYAVGAAALLVARFAYAVHLRLQGKRARALRSRGLCEHCGYDLRGTEFSERCPECGALAE